MLMKKIIDKLDNKVMTINILPNISRRKGNQSMKFGQIIECNMRNIFPKKIKHKMWWEISLKKTPEFSISWDQQP